MGLWPRVCVDRKGGDAKGSEGILPSFHRFLNYDFTLRIRVKLKEEEKERSAGWLEIGLIRKNSSKELLSVFFGREKPSNLLGLHNPLCAGESGHLQSVCDKGRAVPNEGLAYSQYTFRQTWKAKTLKANKTEVSPDWILSAVERQLDNSPEFLVSFARGIRGIYICIFF